MGYKALCWFITPLYLFFFIGILSIFHPILVLAGSFSRAAHKALLDIMNFLILLNMRVTAGTTITVQGALPLPAEKPVILISNHQSMYDIPLLMWTLRKRRVGFVAKKELGKGLPSISYSLRHLDSVLINRKDSSQALVSIRDWGSRLARYNAIACIFPEGTRARNGQMKPFKQAGVLELLQASPNAVIQPVVIEGAWEFLRYNFFPVPWGTRITCTFLDPIENQSDQKHELVQKIELLIRSKLEKC